MPPVATTGHAPSPTSAPSPDCGCALSEAEARTWGVAELFVVGVASGVLILLTHPVPGTAGTIHACPAYRFTFIEGLDVAPRAIERTVQAYDVSRRLGDHADRPPA